MFFTATGKHIASHVLVYNLLLAMCLSSEVTAIKCPVHTNGTDDISLGNSGANAAAKATAV